MLERVIRAMIAADPHPSVMAGKTMCCHVVYPALGSQPKVSENNKIKSIPFQKTGIDTPIKAKNIEELSTTVFCFVAEITPKGIPINTATSIPDTANLIVLG